MVNKSMRTTMLLIALLMTSPTLYQDICLTV
jgi:hypothetical protein